ncbi:MAG: hypothetical protein LBS79_09380 [Tannerella sp.]|nr:hypothetical protein [Tannerella sp.]
MCSDSFNNIEGDDLPSLPGAFAADDDAGGTGAVALHGANVTECVGAG